jgi:hypothetical protein
MPFSRDQLARIDRTEEVDIETSLPGGVTHRTTIWAIVDGDDVFVRSYVGADARWYREATANPAVALWVDGQRLAAEAVLAADPGSIARTSAGLERKYAGDPATPRMVRAEVLPLTIRLDPG